MLPHHCVNVCTLLCLIVKWKYISNAKYPRFLHHVLPSHVLLTRNAMSSQKWLVTSRRNVTFFITLCILSQQTSPKPARLRGIKQHYTKSNSTFFRCRSQWPRGLRQVCRFLPTQIVGSNPTGSMDVCCECCVLSGGGLCDELITHLEESYRRWCVVVCDLETAWMRRSWPSGGWGAVAPKKNKQTKQTLFRLLEDFSIFCSTDIKSKPCFGLTTRHSYTPCTTKLYNSV